MYSFIVPLFWVLEKGGTFIFLLFRIISDFSQQNMLKFFEEYFISFFKGISFPSISAIPDSNYFI